MNEATRDNPADHSHDPLPEANWSPASWNGIERRVSKRDRRKVTLGSFIRGAFDPRRTEGRRAEDRAMPIDWHDGELLGLSLAMLCLSVIDAFMTIRLLAAGAIESNPLLAAVVQDHPAFFAVLKISLTGGGTIVLVAIAGKRLLGIVSARGMLRALTLAYVALVAYEIWLAGRIV